MFAGKQWVRLRGLLYSGHPLRVGVRAFATSVAVVGVIDCVPMSYFHLYVGLVEHSVHSAL